MPDFTLVELFGITGFILHLVAYGWYAFGIFHEKIRPNVAAWFMWLIGNGIELLIYDALPGSHWSTSALPFACVLGVALILCATIFSEAREMGRRTGAITYHPPERNDYYLISFDLAAGALWLWGGKAELANFIAVSTSIISFWPIWRTTFRHPEKEHIGPWLLWSFAYLMMLAAVFLEGGVGVEWRAFYPIYYFFLHGVVVALCIARTRDLIKRISYTRFPH